MGMRSEIAGEIEDALASDLFDATHSGVLIKESATGDLDPLNGYSSSSVSHGYSLGVASNYKQGVIDGVNVQQGDKKLFILQHKVQSVPAPGDVVAAGADGERYEVIAVSSDAANVGYTLQLRGCRD